VEIPAIDLDGKILAGHQRIKVLKILNRGEELIDVRVPNRKLTEEEAKQYLIASNAISGDWDFSVINEFFEKEFLIDCGFEELDLEVGWKDILKIEDSENDFDIERELKEIKKPETKPGDLILLGKHKLLCADSTDINAVKKLFDKDRASMIYSDPPFNINLNYNKGIGGKANYGGSIDDNKTIEEYKEFIKKSLLSAISVTKEYFHCFYWCDEAWVWLFQTLYNELNIKNRRLNIWIKNGFSPTPQVAFNKSAEFCVYGTKGSPYLSESFKSLNELMNKELSNGNALFDELLNIWLEKRLPGNELEHATSKPPALHEKAIKRCTKVGDIILDSFSGSASTMICAEKLKRKVYSLEIEPIFCDLAIKRFKKISNKEIKIIRKYYEGV
jgi:DNA modification methylase